MIVCVVNCFVRNPYLRVVGVAVYLDDGNAPTTPRREADKRTNGKVQPDYLG